MLRVMNVGTAELPVDMYYCSTAPMATTSFHMYALQLAFINCLQRKGEQRSLRREQAMLN